MTENIDLTAIPVYARYCPLCSKRLAAMNTGIHCFTCEDVAAKMSKAERRRPPKFTRQSAPRVRISRSVEAAASGENIDATLGVFLTNLRRLSASEAGA